MIHRYDRYALFGPLAGLLAESKRAWSSTGKEGAVRVGMVDMVAEGGGRRRTTVGGLKLYKAWVFVTVGFSVGQISTMAQPGIAALHQHPSCSKKKHWGRLNNVDKRCAMLNASTFVVRQSTATLI